MEVWLPTDGMISTPRIRRLIIGAGAVEGSLKVAALIDLARRPATEIRGSRARWAAAIMALNSVGAVPVTYLLRGRRIRHDA